MKLLGKIENKKDVVNKEFVEGKGYLTTISSQMVISALGFTPYSSGNPSGYITSNALSGYATQSWVEGKKYLTAIPSEYITEEELSVRKYITGITSDMIAAALGFTPYSSANPNGYITSASIPSALKNPYSLTFGSKTYDGSSSKTITASDLGALTGITSTMVITALGFTPYNADNFTKANIKSTLGISDWALGSSKPSYAFSEITGKPNTLLGYGITDAIPKDGTGATGTWGISITGNAETATKLQTPITIWGQHFDGTGNVGGRATADEFIATNANGFRLAYGNYGTLLRNDGESFFILLTDIGNALNGSFNSLRPFKVSLSTGDIQMDANVHVVKSFKIGSRFRVDTKETAASFGYFKSNIANQNNIGIAHIGTNYGGTTDATKTDYDMTAISMYRGVVGVGKEYDYTSLRAIYNAGVNLGMPNGLMIGSSTLIYDSNILKVSSETSIGQTLHVYSSGTNYTQGIRVYQNGTGYAGLLLGGADLTSTAGTTARSWFISTNSNDRFSISKGGFEPTDSIAFGYNGKWLINGGDLVISANLLAMGGVTMYSQRSLKNIVDERGLSLEELSAIKPTRYTWKDGRDDRIHFGGIADDIQQVLPEVVYNADGTLTMDYGNAAFAIASSLIQPVIRHENEITSLKRKVRELEEEVKRLKRA